VTKAVSETNAKTTAAPFASSTGGSTRISWHPVVPLGHIPGRFPPASAADLIKTTSALM
jgi:hypothetical protein